MKDKELRKMSRMELIEIIYALQQNEKMLRTENTELKRKLEDKKIKIENAGSIAEAALELNRVFEDAQSAAEQYINSAQEAAEIKAGQIIAEAEAKAAEIRAEAENEKT